MKKPPVRKARSLRLPEVLDSALEAKADELGFSVQRLIEIAVDDWLAGQEASQTGSLYSNLGERRPVEVISVERPRETYEHLLPVGVVPASDKHARIACPHPRKARQVFSWGSKCGECGARL